MAVDASRHHQQTGGVDLPCPRVEPVRDGDDLAAAHANVGVERVGRGHHLAAADNEIKVGHVRLERMGLIEESMIGANPPPPRPARTRAPSPRDRRLASHLLGP